MSNGATELQVWADSSPPFTVSETPLVGLLEETVAVSFREGDYTVFVNIPRSLLSSSPIPVGIAAGDQASLWAKVQDGSPLIATSGSLELQGVVQVKGESFKGTIAATAGVESEQGYLRVSGDFSGVLE